MCMCAWVCVCVFGRAELVLVCTCVHFFFSLRLMCFLLPRLPLIIFLLIYSSKCTFCVSTES